MTGSVTPENLEWETDTPGIHTESKEEIIGKLTERIDELTQDEFENLVQAYARAKGFSSVEVSFTMKIEI